MAPTAGPAGSVRPARPQEAAEVAVLQAGAWREAYGDLLPPAALDPAALAPSWTAAVEHPPTPRHRVLVALDAPGVVGFAAAAPAEDADLDPGAAAELLALAVAPEHRRAGHGSRLLQAAADLARDDGTQALVCWVGEHEALLAAFLAGAGWAQDGARRSLDAGSGAPLPQRRWTTRLGQGG
ncbi:GNAT family N-acetyltransferase [Vallicoccus soli]|uniref:GNAT family N-acetyltransferase n=1 Tax=Vallicoccus soli TaxID=2339232 RepID=A0A3A3Z6Y9_9ACTN|nr:GNAT family N-acetyltransferase [Vallicoccus soli]RJK96485.1 GNAT family N-acetyltransferase [Vallicoccus soli]